MSRQRRQSRQKVNYGRNVKPTKRRSRPVLTAVMILLIFAACLFVYMWGNAHITHLCRADVTIDNLPESFEGTKLLFISDPCIRNGFDDAMTAGLFAKLNQTGADMLLLGGDYTAQSTFAALNESEAGIETASRTMAALGKLSFPLGKFAVLGESDEAAAAAKLSAAGVNCLHDASVTVSNGSDVIRIAGLSPSAQGMTNYSKLGASTSAQDTVIVLAHDSSGYNGIRTTDAAGGGRWADLVLSGHTLGGQINLLGRSVHEYTDAQRVYFSGWYNPYDLPILVSQGLGCRGVGLRLGSRSEIWLITLHRGEDTQKDGAWNEIG